MRKVAKYIAAAALLLAAPREADSAQFRLFISNGWTQHDNIPYGYRGRMVFVDNGMFYPGFYSGGYLNTGRIMMNLRYYESGIRYVAPRCQQVRVREATESDGEDALYHALDRMKVPFAWKKYTKGRDRQYIQVDAMVGNSILDVVPTEKEAESRRQNLAGYDYCPVIADDFRTAGEMRGAVMQEVRRFRR